MTNRLFNKRLSSQVISLVLLLAPIFLILLYMHIRILSLTDVPLIGENRMLRAVISIVFDTLLLGGIAFVVSMGKRKVAYSILSLVTCAWCLVNIIYAYYFKTYLTLTAVAEANQMAELSMATYISNALSIYDIIPLAITTLPFIVNKAFRLQIWCGGKKDYAIIAAPLLLMVVYFVGLKLFVYEGKVVVPNQKTIKQVSLVAPEVFLNLTPVLETYQFGVFRAQVFPYLFSSTRRELDDEAKNAIADYLKQLSDDRNDGQPLSDYTEQKKNLIFIIAETYLASSAEATIDGREVTPFLNSLRRDETVVSNDSVVQNTEMGGSSDGQYIYMTGLIPLKDNLTISIAKDKKFVTLAGTLKKNGYQTMMTNPSQAEIWDQSTMCRVYGIDKHYALVEPGEEWKTDKQMISRAIESERGAKPPFFHLMLTISTHSPFNVADPRMQDCTCYPRNKPKDMSEDYFHYLQKCHFMDHALREYIESLKARGLYDNSVIVIASDHGWQEDRRVLPDGVDAERLSCFIIGAPHDSRYVHTQINQIDIFTSVFDLMGITSAWKGMGYSIFRPESHKPSVSEQSRTIAADILYGDYFSLLPD